MKFFEEWNFANFLQFNPLMKIKDGISTLEIYLKIKTLVALLTHMQN